LIYRIYISDLLRLRRVLNFVSFVVQKFLAAEFGAFPTSPDLSAPMGRRGDGYSTRVIDRISEGKSGP